MFMELILLNLELKLLKWLKEEGLKANLKVDDIYKKLPYPDNLFDTIISTQTLRH